MMCVASEEITSIEKLWSHFTQACPLLPRILRCIRFTSVMLCSNSQSAFPPLRDLPLMSLTLFYLSLLMRFPCRLFETVLRFFDRFLESLFHIIVFAECAHNAVHDAWSSSPGGCTRPDLSHNVGHMLYLRFTVSDNEFVEGCSFGRRLAVGVLDLGLG
jgi:hypothetical protein